MSQSGSPDARPIFVAYVAWPVNGGRALPGCALKGCDRQPKAMTGGKSASRHWFAWDSRKRPKVVNATITASIQYWEVVAARALP
jgi:hypothetical protein